MLALGAVAWWSVPAAAGQEALAGRPIADVRIESAGQIVVDPSVLELVETRLGEPLSMTSVRDTIDHLVGLGRFDDVRLYATPAPDGGAVLLRWELRPVQRITRVRLEGRTEVGEATIRSLVAERFGSSPSAARLDDIAGVVTEHLAERGYRASRVTPSLAAERTPGLATLVLAIDAGARTTIRSAVVEGNPPEPADRVLERLELGPGRPYDRPALQQRLAAYEDSLRDQGYYEATVRETAEFPEAAAAMVTVTVEPGPRVRLVFAGDPLAESTLETLVPVREERTVDEDLLEDARRNIEAYLRQRGYRDAQAPYTRTTSGDELVLTFTVTRGALHHVGPVTIAGNARVPTTDLAPLLKIATGEPFVDAQMAAVGAAIAELYRVRGFEQVAVKPAAEVLPEVVDGGARFRPVASRFAIVEGPQTTVSAVTITGSAKMAESRLRDVLGLTPGRPFYRPQLASDRDAIERVYRNDGFLSASVSAALQLSSDGTDATIAWSLREGDQTLVDHVLISGNLRTSSEVIRRELAIAPGQPLGDEAMAESQRRLSELGLFRRVRLTDLPRTASPNRDVLVEVEESPTTAITYGGGVEAGRRTRQAEGGGPAEERIEVAPRAFFQIDRRNLWGKNRSLSFFSRVVLRPRDPPVDSADPTDTGGYGLNEYRFTGTFREPRAFGTAGEAVVTGFVERGIRASFSFDRRGVGTDYARRFGDGIRLTGRYTNDYTERFDEQIAPEDQLLIDRLFPQVHLSTFFGALLRDSRDDVLEPQRGTVIGLDGSVAARAYGSEVGFARTFLQGFVYRRLPGRGFVVAAGARVGLAQGFPREVAQVDEDGNPVLGPDGQPVVVTVDDVPASERFYAGGDTTVRGFALDRLGTDETLDDQGFPQGGNGLVVLNVELRAPYWKSLGLVGFVDSGNVFKNAGDIDLGELRVALGFGVRYRSPIGPLRADLGFKTDPRVLPGGSRERGYVLHISLGQAF